MRAELTAANKVQTVGETMCEGSRVMESLGRANGDRAIDEADSLVRLANPRLK